MAGVALLALGLPLAARGALGTGALAGVAIGVAAVVVATAALLLLRGVARPMDRLLAAAGQLSPGGASTAAAVPPTPDLPLLGEGEGGGFALTRAAVAFERLVRAQEADRAQLAAKVRELTAANAALAEARDSLLRSEKLATVGRLAAGLAHEVGNPLGAVTGYVELARARLPPSPHPDLVDALARIAAAAARIDGTVRELLDFARPTPPLLGPVDLAAAVESALRLAAVQSRFRRVEVAVAIPPDLSPVWADAHRLSQVLLNLLLNAGDAMGGEGTVAIAAMHRPGERLSVTVSDTGPGIPSADLPRIFDPFFTTKDPGAGTGLGLAISHRIMETFGGEIVARNAPGGGAVFELRFRTALR